MPSPREKEASPEAQKLIHAFGNASRDYGREISGQAYELVADTGRNLERFVADLEADRARLAMLARMLEWAAGTTLSGVLEMTFGVLPPDGGAVAVGLGLNEQSEGSDALSALRAALDAAVSPSTPSRPNE